MLVHPLLLQKQTYLISSGSKAKVSHIMISLFFPLPLLLPTRQGEREQSVRTWNQTSDLELIARNLCLVAYLALFSSAQVLKCSEGPFKGKRLHTTSARQKKQAEKNATWWGVTDHYSMTPLPAEPHDPYGGNQKILQPRKSSSQIQEQASTALEETCSTKFKIQASMALEEISSPIQDQASTALESTSTLRNFKTHRRQVTSTCMRRALKWGHL